MSQWGIMDKAFVSAKGQVVIPCELRRRFGIKKGTQVCMYESNGAIVIEPITDEYIRNMAGITGTKGKLRRALMREKACSIRTNKNLGLRPEATVSSEPSELS